MNGFVKVEIDIVKKAIDNYDKRKKEYDSIVTELRTQAQNTSTHKHNWFGWKWGKTTLWESLVERDSWGDRMYLPCLVKESSVSEEDRRKIVNFYSDNWYSPDDGLPTPIWWEEILELKQLVRGGDDLYLSGEVLSCVNRWRD